MWNSGGASSVKERPTLYQFVEQQSERQESLETNEKKKHLNWGL